MKYSIITPCGRHDLNRIKELARNLAKQNSHDFEWIIACNQSLELPSVDFPVKIVKFQPNTVGAAKNEAMKIAKGKYLFFIDADDYLESGTINLLNHIVGEYSDDTVYDVNCYQTYEPEKSSQIEMAKESSFNDALPDWGGSKYDKPEDRYFNFDVKNNDIDTHFSLWLQNRYWIYDKEYRYTDLDDQLFSRGKVISKQFIEDHHFHFNEDNSLYPDIQFMLLVTEFSAQLIKLSDYHYIKINHNDPINDPSLSQIPRNDRWQLWANAGCRALLKLNDQTLMNVFSKTVINNINTYFYKNLVTKDQSIGNNEVRTLLEIQKFLQLIDPRTYSNLKRINQKVLNAIKSGNFSSARHLMKVVIGLRNANQLVVNRGRGITKDTYFTLFKHVPVNPHVILFESFLGRNYSDSPKYIYRYLQKHYGSKYKYVWIADAEHFDHIKSKLKSQPNTKVVRRFGFQYMYYLATSKYFVFNMRQPKWFVKRPGMRFIETWHGTPLKHLVFDMDNVASASHLYKQTFYYQSRQWDHLVTANQYSYNIFHRAFMYPKDKMLKSGYPRNDILNSPRRDQIAKHIKQKLGIPLNKKVILYAPTWRDDQFYGPGQYKFKLHLNLAELKKHLSDQYVLILRTHYFIANHIDTSQFGDFVFNESNYDDIAELYLISDILITDYSSVFFDYAILKRPILYYVYDYDDYADVLRGFYLNMKKDLPGPLLKTSKSVLNAIENIDEVKSKYHDRYVQFNHRFNTWDDGHASARVAHALLKS